MASVRIHAEHWKLAGQKAGRIKEKKTAEQKERRQQNRRLGQQQLEERKIDEQKPYKSRNEERWGDDRQ